MRMIPRSLATLLTLACALTAWASIGQESRQHAPRPPDSVDGLRITISLGGKEFRHKDTPELKVRLENVGDAPLMIHKDIGWYGETSLGLDVRDENDRRVLKTFLWENFPTSPLPEEEFVSLNPGESLTREHTLILEWYEFEKSGDYSLSATYRGATMDFVPEGLTARVWSGGPITSKPLKFKFVKE